jgi:hypothetical protein
VAQRLRCMDVDAAYHIDPAAVPCLATLSRPCPLWLLRGGALVAMYAAPWQGVFSVNVAACCVCVCDHRRSRPLTTSHPSTLRCAAVTQPLSARARVLPI